MNAGTKYQEESPPYANWALMTGVLIIGSFLTGVLVAYLFSDSGATNLAPIPPTRNDPPAAAAANTPVTSQVSYEELEEILDRAFPSPTPETVKPTPTPGRLKTLPTCDQAAPGALCVPKIVLPATTPQPTRFCSELNYSTSPSETDICRKAFLPPLFDGPVYGMQSGPEIQYGSNT